MISWPESLPQGFMPGTYETTFVDTRVAFEVDQGLPKLSQRHSKGPYPVSGTMHIRGEQLATLRAFFQTDTAGGTVVFEFPSPEGGDDLLVRFARVPEVSALSVRGLFKVSIELEVLP